MNEVGYNRSAAVEYAKQWAMKRNPAFYDFSDIGGDCTGFISQCVYAGSGVMNYTPTFGWYYISSADRSPSWTGVQFFYNFMTENHGLGPYGTEVRRNDVRLGDVIQLGNRDGSFFHSLIVCSVNRGRILVCAHSADAYMKPLSAYRAPKIRYIHIEGVRSK